MGPTNQKSTRNPEKHQEVTMGTHDYVSVYIADDSARNSVMAAQANKSIKEVHEREFRRPHPDKFPRFKLEFDGDAFSGAIGTLTVVIEGLCFGGAEGWDETHCPMPERPKLSDRLSGGPATRPINLGNDRATLSLYDPLKNLEDMLGTFLRRVEDWSNKPKYFKEVTIPFIIRTIEHSTSEASTAKKIRAALEFVGPIDIAYVRSFTPLSRSMDEPIGELRALGELIASILREGDEISPLGSGHVSPTGEPPLRESAALGPFSHLSKVHDPVAGASVSRRPVETKGASALPTSSDYLSKILNPEPASQASIRGHVKTESTVSQRGGGSNAFEDLLEAATYGSSPDKDLSSPTNEPERESPVGLQYPGSPSYSPPPSPAISINALLEFFPAASIQAEEPARNISSSILLQPSTLYHIKRPTAPPGTPKWKMDLHDRKGHPLHVLHVGPRELDILAKCLPLVHAATLKAQECMRVVIDRKTLATDMEQEHQHWDEICMELEDNVAEEQEARKEKKEREESTTHTKTPDDDAKGRAKNRPVYGPEWLGTADANHPARARRTNAPPPTHTDSDDTDDQDGSVPHSQSSTVRGQRGGSPMSVSRPSSSSAGTEEVTHFEEAVGGHDLEMPDVGEGGIATVGKDEGVGSRVVWADGERGWRSGGRVVREGL